MALGDGLKHSLLVVFVIGLRLIGDLYRAATVVRGPLSAE